MTPAGDILPVRQFERVVCSLPASIQPSGSSRDQVRVARTVGDGSGRVAATLTDCSQGGLSLASPVFFPKNALLTVKASNPAGELVFEGHVRVQRIAMVGREPRYDLGCAFIQDGLESANVTALIDAARATSPHEPQQVPRDA